VVLDRKPITGSWDLSAELAGWSGPLERERPPHDAASEWASNRPSFDNNPVENLPHAIQLMRNLNICKLNEIS